MSRRRQQRSVELPTPALGHVVLPHTSKIKGWSLQYAPYLELRPGSQFVTVQKLPVTA